MRIAIMSPLGFAPLPSIDPVIDGALDAERRGFAGFYIPNVFGIDAMTVLAVAGQRTERIELGTGVVPTYPRHPATMAQQALTVQTASGGRFALGIGLSHKMVIEGMFGLSFDRPVRHMRNYLEILAPALRGEALDVQNEQFSYRGQLAFECAPVPLLVAALGEQMLRLSGRVADGTLTWMTGLKTLDGHTVPVLSQAASEAGRPQPRIVAGLPVHVTDDRDGARDELQRRLGHYGNIPSYKAMLEREGAEVPADVALSGSESDVRAGLARLRDIGVTDLLAAPSDDKGARGRTLDFLAGEV